MHYSSTMVNIINDILNGAFLSAVLPKNKIYLFYRKSQFEIILVRTPLLITYLPQRGNNFQT